MLRLIFPSVRRLHRELAQERRVKKALQEANVDLRNHQERLCSDLRYLREQIWHLESENQRAFALVAKLKAQKSKKNAHRSRDEHGRFA